MPIYEYECEHCHARVELEQPLMEHSAPEVCPSCNCKHTMKRVFTASTVIFKGSGYYCTDNQRSDGKQHKE
jgi:putative FmdB family regulatory protein